MNETCLVNAKPAPIKLGLVRVFFPGFLNNDWSEAYLRAVDKVARDITVDRKSALDHFTMRHVAMMSIGHAELQTWIAERFLSELRAQIAETFDLRFRLKFIKLSAQEIVAEYGFERAKDDVLQHVLRVVREKDGDTPPDIVRHDAHIVAWLIICLNAVHRGKFCGKRADAYAMILEQFERENELCPLMHRAIDQAKLTALLESPVETIAASRTWAFFS